MKEGLVYRKIADTPFKIIAVEKLEEIILLFTENEIYAYGDSVKLEKIIKLNKEIVKW